MLTINTVHFSFTYPSTSRAMALSLIIIGIILTSILYWYLSIPKRLPPGPLNLPFLGYYLHWDQVHKKFVQLGKKYGPVCCFYRFNQLVIVINDYDTIKQAMVKQGDCFAGKLDNGYALRTLHLKEGLLYIDGDRWLEQRRFSLSTLRDLGIGRPVLEQCIMDEIQSMLPIIRSYAIKGQTWKPQRLLEDAVANVISRLIFGKRYDYEDMHFNRLVRAVVTIASRVNLGSLIGFQSWFRFLPIVRGIWNQGLKNQKVMYGIFEKFINEHEKFDQSSIEVNDYIDAFRQQQNNGKGVFFNDAQLLFAVRDLFGAGLDTTSSTLLWSILLCAVHPNVQRKCQEELDSICESSGEPILQNRSQTPYVEATIMEIQRWASVLAFLSRRTTKECDLGPYKIPAGSAVFVNTWSVHMNETYFPNSDQFDPNRFIDTETGQVIKCEMLLPFGLGKRVCMGEALARMELYLIFTSLLRHFTFRFPENAPPPNMGSLSAMTLRPHPYEVLIERRHFDMKN